MNKRNIITSYRKLPSYARALFDTTYGKEYRDQVMWIGHVPNPFYALILETPEATYLVKVGKPDWRGIGVNQDALKMPAETDPKETWEDLLDLPDTGDIN